MFPSFKKQFFSHSPDAYRGFTLIELLIVLVIIVTMSTIIFTNLPDFDADKRLQIVAQEISLAMREAQVYGVAVLSSQVTPQQLFPGKYGVQVTGSPLGFPHIVLFADTDNNNIYSIPPADTLVSSQTITAPISIVALCVNALGTNANSGGEAQCGGNEISITQATLLFERPGTEAVINSNDAGAPDGVQYIRIILANGKNYQSIYLWQSGQISIINPNQGHYYAP